MTTGDLTLALRLGARNLWRNPRRSIITGLAMGTALLVLMVLSALLGGLREQLLHNGTELLLGHIQAHHADYFPERHVADVLAPADLADLLRRLEQREDVLAAAPRVRAHALVSSGEASSGAELLGVEPALERKLSVLLERIDGTGLADAPGRQSMVLGATLARELGVSMGDELAVVTQAADGSLGNELFTVTGILRTGTRGLDRSLALTHAAELRQLLALGPESSHELALRIDQPMQADAVAAVLAEAQLFPEPGRVRAWGEIAPQLRDYIAMNEGASRFLLLLVGLFAAFGVMNSMLMAVYERMREFGTLNALGVRPGVILATLLVEALLIAILGLTAGFLVALPVLHDMITSGWDLSRWTGEMAMMDTRLDPVLQGVWVSTEIARAALGLTIAALLAVLVSAMRVLRLDPITAMAAPTDG